MADGTLSTVDYCSPGGDTHAKTTAIGPKQPVEMLFERLSGWGDKYGAVGQPWVQAAEIVQYMQAVNRTFGAGPNGSLYYLNRGDLFPRNIMIQVLGENVAFVTDILDWDDSCFAPAVVSFSPPAWL